MPQTVLYIEGSGHIEGGGQFSLLGLLQNIDREQFKPLLVCPFEGSLTTKAKELGITVEIVPMEALTGNPTNVLRALSRLIRLINRTQPALIHANTSRSMFYAGLSARKWGIPTIWHVRVIDSEGWYDRLLAGLSTKIIVISEAVMKRFQWLHTRKPDKLKMIYNGVDIDAFHPDIKADHIREEFNILMRSPIVGIVGNLLEWKGQRYFIQAAAEIAKVIPDAKFLIVGDGEDKGYLENLCHRLGLDACVFFTGRRYDIPQLMAAMDVIIHASVDAEPFGRVVIEGMAMGKVVVATNAGGVREIVENGVTGFLIPSRNSSVMAEIVAQAIKDPARRRDVGINARRHVERYFSIQEHTRQVENLYRQIMNQRQVKVSRNFVKHSDITVGK